MGKKLSISKLLHITIVILVLNTISFTAFSQNIWYDVYSAGCYYYNGKDRAAIYKNDEILYKITGGTNSNAILLAVSSYEDVYWINEASNYSDKVYYLKKMKKPFKN